jgi:quercetin dioxygenase-like cupin family protein
MSHPRVVDAPIDRRRYKAQREDRQKGESKKGRGYMTRVTHRVSLSLLCALVSQQAAAQDHTMVKPADLKWTDVPAMTGAQIAVLEGKMSEAGPFTARLKLPNGTKIPAHFHSTIEHVTVLSGTINMGVGDKLDITKSMPLGTGSMGIMQPGTHHFAWTSEDTIIQLHGTGPWTVTYVDPADDPRKK